MPFWVVFFTVASILLYFSSVKSSGVSGLFSGVSLCTDKAPPAPFCTTVLCKFPYMSSPLSGEGTCVGQHAAERNVVSQTMGLRSAKFKCFVLWRKKHIGPQLPLTQVCQLPLHRGCAWWLTSAFPQTRCKHFLKIN